MAGTKGEAYTSSGRTALNLQWLAGVTKNWAKMSEGAQTSVLLDVARVMGHEITHIAQLFGERSGLAIDGVPLQDAVMAKVEAMSLSARRYVIEQLRAQGAKLSEGVLSYLSGDVEATTRYYSRQAEYRGMVPTDLKARQLAANEFMAEIGAHELIRRAQVADLPTALRSAIDKFKQVLGNVIAWFKGNAGEAAELTSLQDISAKMLDHFSAADRASLHEAFPTSELWKPEESPAEVASLQQPGIHAGSLMSQKDFVRLCVRAGVGGATDDEQSNLYC
jgi:hypothetical protein